MRTYIVIPDIHGQITKLREALAYIMKNFLVNTGDWQVVFLGDYIDRGEKGEYQGKIYADVGSLLVLLELLEFESYCKSKKIPLTFLLGNHEDAYRYDQNQINQDMPSIPLDENTSFCFEKTGIAKELLRFIGRCELYLLDKKAGYLFVHAGIDPHNHDPSHNKKETLLWIRDSFIDYSGSYPFTVVFGHTPFKEILHKKERIGLDGGACIQEIGYGKLNISILTKEERRFLCF